MAAATHDVVRMWQQPVELFLHGGLGLLPLATLCRLPEGKDSHEGMRDVVREIDQRLVQESDHAKAVRLMTASFILAGMRVEKESLASIYEGVRIMHESTAFDMAIEEGQFKTSYRMLLRQGARKFGLAADARTENELKAIKDLDRLERMADAILTANSWQELLATP